MSAHMVPWMGPHCGRGLSQAAGPSAGMEGQGRAQGLATANKQQRGAPVEALGHGQQLLHAGAVARDEQELVQVHQAQVGVGGPHEQARHSVRQGPVQRPHLGRVPSGVGQPFRAQGQLWCRRLWPEVRWGARARPMPGSHGQAGLFLDQAAASRSACAAGWLPCAALHPRWLCAAR